MKSTRFIHRVRANALSIPDGSPLLSTETMAMAGIVSRDLFAKEEARAIFLSTIVPDTCPWKEQKKKEEEGGRKEETARG